MPDPTTGLETGGDQETVIDYLGRPVAVSFKGQPALPVGGPVVGVPTAPTSPGGTGAAAAPTVTGQPTPVIPSQTPGGTSSNLLRAIGALEQGLKLKDISQQLFPDAATPPGPLGEGLAVEALNASREAAGAPPFTAQFTDPRFPDLAFPTTGPMVGIETAPLGAPVMAAGESAGGINLGLLGAEEAFPGASVAAEVATPGASNIPGVIPILGAASNIFAAFQAHDPIQKGLSATDAALFTAAAFQPAILPFAVGLGILDSILELSGIFGHQGSFAPKRQKAGAAASADVAQFTAGLQGGLKTGTVEGLFTGLQGSQGGGGDPFNPGRVPIAVDLRPPTAWTQQRGWPDSPLDQTTSNFVFDPMRASAKPQMAITLPMFQQYLDEVRRNPAALDWLIGSGDVGFLPQAAAESAAAANKANARRAIQLFLAEQVAPAAAPEALGATPPTPDEVRAKLSAMGIGPAASPPVAEGITPGVPTILAGETAPVSEVSFGGGGPVLEEQLLMGR